MNLEEFFEIFPDNECCAFQGRHTAISDAKANRQRSQINPGYVFTLD